MLDGSRPAARRAPLRDVSLTLRAGEIVGIAGVSGNGQRELADLVAGVLQPERGHDRRSPARSSPSRRPKRMQALKVGRVPEDRLTTGMIGALPLAEIDGAALGRRAALQPPRHSRTAAPSAASPPSRSTASTSARPGPEARTGTLSGGNLQKALLAREIARDPKILLAAQPTRGIDVGATEFIHGQFLALRARGGAVLLISEDLEEIFALSDRIAVMYRGRIMADLPVGGGERRAGRPADGRRRGEGGVSAGSHARSPPPCGEGLGEG